jgi:putative spermidine/putrescine transport system substrate-binding protein
MPPTTRRLPALALALALVTLAACGSTDASDPVTSAAGSSDPTAYEGAVSILAWPGYVEDGANDPEVDWVTPFEEETGCQVTAKSYGTSDEAYNLVLNGGYDVVVASGDLTLRLIAKEAVIPVDTARLDNYADIFDFLKLKEWNSVDGQPYGVPHGYGANLLMYNVAEVTPAPTSWSAVFDDAAKYSGKVTAYDSPIYIADAALYLMVHQPELGIENPYALDQTQFDAAIDLLKAQNEHISEYWGDYLVEIQSFEGGDSYVGTTWQVIQSAMTPGLTEAILPEEGATGWSDTWMITADAASPNCAYAWLDYISSPEANATATAYFGEAPSSQLACQFRDDCEAYHAGDASYADQIWYWTTPIADCVDGRTDVECVDYSQWTAAWQEIKG